MLKPFELGQTISRVCDVANYEMADNIAKTLVHEWSVDMLMRFVDNSAVTNTSAKCIYALVTGDTPT